MVVFGQSGCNWEKRAKEVVLGKVFALGKKWLYSAKVVVFGQSGCIIGKSCCIRAKWLYLGKSGCIRAKLVLFQEKVVVFETGSIWEKVVVFGKIG